VAWLGGSVEALKLAVGDADAGAALVGEAVGDTVVGETVLGEVVGDSVGETVGDSVVGDRVGVHVSPASVGVRVLGEALGETVVVETVVGDTVGETVLGEAVVGGTVGVPVINGANSRVYLAESNDPHCSHKPPTQVRVSKAEARLDLEVSVGWVSPSSRGLWGGTLCCSPSALLETETQG
jgi:hypothetical protein